MDQPKYRAFISYSHRDAKWGDWLHKALESYRPPRQLVGVVTARGPVPKRLTPVFRDREELASATDLGTLLTEALRQSACQIVICSRQSAKSRWVNEEILAFKRLGREDRIFCLIVDGEPNASDIPAQVDEECFAPALRFKLGPDQELSTVRAEPIAADARPGKDGKARAKLKLIAGVLGLGFDALARREQQRHNRQLFVIASAATAGMVLTSGLAGYALVQRTAARHHAARAEAEAETAQQTTNFLVELFRISDPSEARGNTVTAREMLDKGATRIEGELAKQPNIQATLLDTVGTVYMGLGLYGKARPLLERALATRKQLTGAGPVVLSDSLNHRGELLMWQADYAAAEKDYRDVLRLLASQPDDRRNRAALAKAQYGLGIVLAFEGRYADARASLSDALARQRALYGEANDDVARTLNQLANVMAQNGELKAAIDLMRAGVAIERGLRGSEPDPALAGTINDLAVMLDNNQNYDESESLFVESLAIWRRVYGEKHADIASGLSSLAWVLSNKGDFTRSEATYREALAMQRELLGELHPDYAFTLGALAYVQQEKGDTRLALATLQESLRIYQRLFPGDHPDVARIMTRLGFFRTLAGDYAVADRDLRTALEMRRRLLDKSHPDVASSLAYVAILQVATGNFADAERLAREARALFASALSPTHSLTAVAESAEGAALTGRGDYAQAETLLNESYGILSKDPTMLVQRSLARSYLENLHRQERRHAGRTPRRNSPAQARGRPPHRTEAPAAARTAGT